MARTVLFANPKIAAFINESFEPVWQSVRRVPIINIDLGNGKLIKRTLNGNVASYVCDATGNVLDVLPGLYAPEAYEDRLNQLKLLNAYLETQPDESRTRVLISYHKTQLARLEKRQSPSRFSSTSHSNNSKPIISFSANKIEPNKNWSHPPDTESFKPKPIPDHNLARWQMLTDDVRLNETINRKKIHEKLSKINVIAEEESFIHLTHWMYKDILHADLDDPYFGIGEILNKNYPFQLAQNGDKQ